MGNVSGSRRSALLCAFALTVAALPAGAAAESRPAPADRYPVRVLSTSGQVTNADALTRPGSSAGTVLTRTAHDPPATIVLDYGRDIGGVPEFGVQAAAGHPVLSAGYAEAARFLTPAGDNGRPFHSGDPARADTYTVSQPGVITNQFIQGGERYQQLTLQSPGSVTLSFARIRSTSFPDPPDASRGFFLSSSDELNKLWDAGDRTLRLNMLPGNALNGAGDRHLILDGAKRDRDVWEGDLSVEAPTLFYSCGAAEYVRDSLRLLGSYQLQSGFIEGRRTPSDPLRTGLLPGTVSQYSASYSMYFVANLATYYHYTGDLAFVREEWPVVQRELAWNAQQVDSQGLFETNTKDGNNWHYDDQTGAQTYYNALYYRILNDGTGLADALGDRLASENYRRQATNVQNAVNRSLFNPATGVYDISTTQRGWVAQDANTFAVEYGIAPADRRPGILRAMAKALGTPHGNLSVSSPAPSGYHQIIGPFMGSYELWARFAAGDTAGAFDLLHREWAQMTTVDPGDVLWEVMGPDGSVHTPGINHGGDGVTSLAHGWSTGPTSALSRYVLGIAPTAPGYRTWEVVPQPGSLAWAEGRAPTPRGPLTVTWDHRSGPGGFAMTVTPPPATAGTIAVPLFGKTAVVQVNGRLVWDGASFHAAPGVTAAARQGDYLRISVSAGTGHSYEVRSRAASI